MSDKLKIGDKIRIVDFYGNSHDMIVEEFRNTLGVFECDLHRTMQDFTPISELYEPAPDAVQKYMGNMGEYYDKYVPRWVNITT